MRLASDRTCRRGDRQAGHTVGLDPTYTRVLSPWSPGQLAAPVTPKRSFTLKHGGLVAIRYDYLFGDSAGSIITTIDGKELFHATAAIDGVGRSVERTHYVFLAAGKHTLAFGVTGGQTLWLAGVTVGLDPTYTRVLSPWSPGQLAAPVTPKRSFTLKHGGLVAIRYNYLFGDSAGSIITTIDGKELFHATAAIDGVGRSVERTHYVFLAAGKHTLAFGVTGGQTLWLAGVTVGLDPTYTRVLSPWSPGQLAAPVTPKRSFTLKHGGLVAIRYDYLFGDPAGSIITTIDGKELFHATAAIDGVGRSVERTHYVFLAAGKHTLAFGVTGGQTLWLAGVTVGLKLETPIP